MLRLLCPALLAVTSACAREVASPTAQLGASGTMSSPRNATWVASATASATPSAASLVIGAASTSASTPPDRTEIAAKPSYDLTADVEARKLAARQELGNHISVLVVRGVFVIVGPVGQVTGAARTAEIAIDTYLNGRFTQPPSRAVSVYLFPSAKPYEAYCKLRWNEPCISGFGFYTHPERLIVMNVGPGVGTLTHELVHPIFETDFPRAPTWFEEGVASLYEGFGIDRHGQLRGVKNWRLPALKAAINNPKLKENARVDALFGMSDATFRGNDESFNYALARYFCLWLEQRNLLWAFYRQWKDNYASDTTGEKSFVTVTGKSPSDSNAAFVRWLRAL